MKILFIADHPSGFQPYKDTTVTIMREMTDLGLSLYFCESSALFYDSRAGKGHQVKAKIDQFTMHIDKLYALTASSRNLPKWFTLESIYKPMALNQFDAVLMRTDPPFDMQYYYATQLLSLAEQEGALVINRAQALREFNEKLAILNFPQFVAPTLVSTSLSNVRDFLEQHGDIIVKPLDGMGGMGVFRLTTNSHNTGSTLEMLMRNGTRTIMAQRYLPAITEGDKRILIIGNEVVPFALARIPQEGETRGNLAAGGAARVKPLNNSDRLIAETVKPWLLEQGVYLAGLDVIGDCLTEINITSPTGFSQIYHHRGFDCAALFTSTVQSLVANK